LSKKKQQGKKTAVINYGLTMVNKRHAEG